MPIGWSHCFKWKNKLPFFLKKVNNICWSKATNGSWKIVRGCLYTRYVLNFDLIEAIIPAHLRSFFPCRYSDRYLLREKSPNLSRSRACLKNASILASRFFCPQLNFWFEGNIKPIWSSNRKLKWGQNNPESRALSFLRHALVRKVS